jgi:chromosome segregation ATPase
MPLTSPPENAAETQLETLESKVLRALALLTEARQENARLRKELAEAERERGEVRRRVEHLLKQIDSLAG